MAIERGNRPFTGVDPEGDARIRERMTIEWERQTTLTEIKKALPQNASPFITIDKLLKQPNKNGRPIIKDAPFVVVGIQRIDKGDGKDRGLYVSSTFPNEQEAKRYMMDMRYREFDTHRSFFSYIDSTNGKRPDNWVDFFVVDMVWLRDKEQI